MASTYYTILCAIIVWFSVFSLYFLLSKKHLRLADNPELTTVYFAISSIFVYYSFRDYLPLNFFHLLPLYFLSIIIVFFLMNYLYFTLKHHFQEPLLLIKRHPLDHWLEANRRTLFTRSAHLMFQQSIITVIIFALKNLGLPLWQISGIFSLIFGAMHVPLIFAKGSFITVMFTVTALAGGIILRVILLKLPYGFIVNYVIHMSFYAFITFFFWKYQNRIKR